jgi:hypothetical protein
MTRSAVRSRLSPAPFSCQTTTSDATISISESSPKPASAIDRATTAAASTTTLPTTFHPSVAYSSRKTLHQKSFGARRLGRLKGSHSPHPSRSGSQLRGARDGAQIGAETRCVNSIDPSVMSTQSALKVRAVGFRPNFRPQLASRARVTQRCRSGATCGVSSACGAKPSRADPQSAQPGVRLRSGLLVQADWSGQSGSMVVSRSVLRTAPQEPRD